MLIEISCRRNKTDADFLQLCSHCTKKRLGIALLQLGQEDEGLKIGPKIEQVARSNLTGHK